MTFLRSRVSPDGASVERVLGGEMIGNIEFDAYTSNATRETFASIESYVDQPVVSAGDLWNEDYMMGGRLVFNTMAPDKTGLSHIMTLANSNKILLGDERSNETFVIGRTETNASSHMFPYGDGSATIIKGQDAMFGHGGNVTLKGGNANGISEIGGSIVLQPGHSSPGYEGGSIIFQDGWGTERFHINDNKLEIGTPDIDLRAQAKTVLIADGEHEALRFVTSDDESLLAFDTANGTVSIHGTLNVHGAIREEPCVISLGLGDSYLYELCGKKYGGYSANSQSDWFR